MVPTQHLIDLLTGVHFLQSLAIPKMWAPTLLAFLGTFISATYVTVDVTLQCRFKTAGKFKGVVFLKEKGITPFFDDIISDKIHFVRRNRKVGPFFFKSFDVDGGILSNELEPTLHMQHNCFEGLNPTAFQLFAVKLPVCHEIDKRKVCHYDVSIVFGKKIEQTAVLSAKRE